MADYPGSYTGQGGIEIGGSAEVGIGPIRERILSAFATQLGASRQPSPIQSGDAPLIAIVGEDETSENDYGKIRCTMSVTVESIAAYGDMSRASKANYLLAALVRAATNSDQTFGGLAESMRYASGSTIYPDTEGLLVGARAVFEIVYWYDVGNPFVNT